MKLPFDALHTHTGLLVFFVTVVVFREFRSTALPLICVLGVEVFLLWGELTGDEALARPALAKLLSAIIWPFVIVTLSRLNLLVLLARPFQEGAELPPKDR